MDGDGDLLAREPGISPLAARIGQQFGQHPWTRLAVQCDQAAVESAAHGVEQREGALSSGLADDQLGGVGPFGVADVIAHRELAYAVVVGIPGEAFVAVGVNAVLGQSEFGGVLDGVDPLRSVDGGQKGLAERCFAPSHSGGHHDVGPDRSRHCSDQDLLQMRSGHVEVVQGGLSGHIRPQHHGGRMAHERLGMESPPVAQSDVQAAIEHVKPLGLPSGETGQMPGGLDQLIIGGKR